MRVALYVLSLLSTLLPAESLHATVHSTVSSARFSVPVAAETGELKVPRREALRLASTVALGASCNQYPARAAEPIDGPSKTADRRYGPLLQGPFDFPSASRATVRRELVSGRIWSFEQVQGVIYVQIPVRMTVVKLESGGLFVYAPIAPTVECLRLLTEIEAEHGAVTHILLPTLAIEHKSFAGAFADARPTAQLWVAPAQYSFPLDLPLALTGFPRSVKRLPADDAAESVPWASQLPYRTLEPLREKVGAFQEVVVFDRPSGTLLVTDLVCSLPSEPPAILVANDLRALLYHSRDEPTDVPVDTPEARAIGWKKICLFACYFQSSPLVVPAEPDGTLAGAARFFRAAFSPDMPAAGRVLGWAGFFAWRWRPEWRGAFDALRGGGRPFVPPILQELVLSREPDRVLSFAERVANDFKFTSILPAHFEPVVAGPREWLDAFRPFGPTGINYPGALPEADLGFLRQFERQLVDSGTIRPRVRPQLPSSPLA